MLRQACRAASRSSRSFPSWWLASDQGAPTAVWQHAQLRAHSTRDPSLDELNRELASYFGGAALQPDAAESATDGVGPRRDAQQPAAAAAELERRAAVLNQEMLDFFGAPPGSAEDTAAAAEALSSHIQGQAGGRPQAHPHRSANAPSFQQQEQQQEQPWPSKLVAGGPGSSGEPPGLTHVDAAGRAAMVDVSQKADSVRSATAAARVLLGPEVYALVASNQLKKGDVLTVAQLAGVMGAKHTATLIPLCHNITLSKVGVELRLVPEAHAVDIEATARCVGPTGVEMEALTAAAVSALTVYDMVKAASKGTVITDLRLLEKGGGKSGAWRRGGGGAG